MRFILTTILVLALVLPAYADEADALPHNSIAATEPALLDRNVALALSVGGTVTSLGLLIVPTKPTRIIGATSLLLTPSLGEWYVGKFLTPGLGLRLGAVAAGLAYGLATGPCDDIPERCHVGRDLLVALAGLSVYATGVAVDIATARSTVDQHNQSLHRPKFAPAVLASSSGPVMGIGIGGSF